MRAVLLVAVVVPAAAWMLVKPVRMVAPSLMGLSCPPGPVCVEEGARYPQALALYQQAHGFVDRAVSPLAAAPKFIFCSTEQCADAFGLGARSAVTVGTLGTVVGPRAWKDYYVRHELIHHLQGERIGVLRLLGKPSWFVEGMAYALSQDPRPTLREPFESDRRRFLAWYGALGQRALWDEAGRL